MSVFDSSRRINDPVSFEPTTIAGLMRVRATRKEGITVTVESSVADYAEAIVLNMRALPNDHPMKVTAETVRDFRFLLREIADGRIDRVADFRVFVDKLARLAP